MASRFLGVLCLVKFLTHFRQRLATPLAGASCNVKFTPDERLFGLILIALLSPAVLRESDEVHDIAMRCYAAIAPWGVLTL